MINLALETRICPPPAHLEALQKAAEDPPPSVHLLFRKMISASVSLIGTAAVGG